MRRFPPIRVLASIVSIIIIFVPVALALAILRIGIVKVATRNIRGAHAITLLGELSHNRGNIFIRVSQILVLHGQKN